MPNVKLCSPLGNVVFFRLWLNFIPNVKLCSPLGRVVLSRLWLNFVPNVKLILDGVFAQVFE